MPSRRRGLLGHETPGLVDWLHRAVRAAGPAADAAGQRLRSVLHLRRYPPDFDPDTIATIERVRRITLTSPERLFALCKAVEHVVENAIEGAIVECGVYRGGSMMAAAITLLRAGDSGRDLYLFDTFEGMTQPTAHDHDLYGRHADQLPPGLRAWPNLDSVRRRMLSTGYPRERLHLVPGPVESTVPGEAPDRIALLRLDTDWYESTMHELVHLFPRLVTGGVLIIDDYGHWQGARRAVDEYLRENRIPLLLHRIDYTGRIAEKMPWSTPGSTVTANPFAER